MTVMGRLGCSIMVRMWHGSGFVTFYDEKNVFHQSLMNWPLLKCYFGSWNVCIPGEDSLVKRSGMLFILLCRGVNYTL